MEWRHPAGNHTRACHQHPLLTQTMGGRAACVATRGSLSQGAALIGCQRRWRPGSDLRPQQDEASLTGRRVYHTSVVVSGLMSGLI